MNTDQQRWWQELGLQLEGLPATLGEPAGLRFAASPVAPPVALPVAKPSPAGPMRGPAPAAPAPASESRQALRAAAIAHLALDQIPAHVRACTACPLHDGRTQAVPGLVAPGAPWLFVGEAPGAEDDATGEAFGGAAGALLDGMLQALGLQRGVNASLLSVVRCRPLAGRAPSPPECEACLPYLQRQLALLQPQVVVALGKTASQQLLGSAFNLGSLRGKVHAVQGRALVATYHPDYLLRNPAEKARAWADLCLARRALPPG